MEYTPAIFFNFNRSTVTDNRNDSENQDNEYLVKSYLSNRNHYHETHYTYCHRLRRKKSIYQHQIKTSELMNDYINGNTNNFTDDNWLHLIIKMGKKNFNKNKYNFYKSWCNHVDNSILLTKISQLQPLREELESLIFNIKETFSKISFFLQYHNINNEKISKEQLQSIIDKAKSLGDFKVISNNKELLAHNLIYEYHNPFFSELVIASYRNNKFLPRNFEYGIQLKTKIDNIELEYPEENLNIISLLQNKSFSQKICGGRTLQLINKNTQECFYLKFQRYNENWYDFIKEKNMHVSLAQLGITDQLKSEIPISQYLFKITADLVTFEFTNELEIYINNNIKYVYGYCFKASENYVKYVGGHDCELIEKNLLSENGLKKAVADIAKLASYGLIFDSIIEAYHGILDVPSRGDGWSAMRFIDYTPKSDKNSALYPCSMSKWISRNHRSDISYSGIRDLGDSSFFNHYYNSSLNNKSSLSRYPENTKEILIYCSTLLNNMIAIVILYAHGKRNTANYNFKNLEVILEVQNFIEQILNIFLKEYYENNTISIKSILNISDEDYNNWLKRTSEEIVYWTMKQPETNDWKRTLVDENYVSEITKTYQLSYVKDILQTGFLNTELYPDQYYKFTENSLHPFTINELSLGLTHGLNFPLKAFINGVCLMLTNLIING